MNKRALFLTATSFCGTAGMITLHFVSVEWGHLALVVLISMFSFGTGVVVGAVERDRIFGRKEG